MPIENAVHLEPLDESHLNQVFDWMKDESLREHIGTVMPVYRTGHLEWYRRLISDPQQAVFAIIASDSRHIGAIGLRHIQLYYRNAEVWIYLGQESERHHGSGSQALSLLLDYAFCTLGLHRLFAHVFDFNQRAQRFFTKSGFKPEGILRDAAFKRGAFIGVHVFGILSHEARASPSPSSDSRPV